MSNGFYVLSCIVVAAAVVCWWLWLAYTREPKKHVDLVSDAITSEIKTAVANSLSEELTKHFAEHGEGTYR